MINSLPKVKIKEGKVGKIPEGWHEIALQELATFQRGFDLPKQKREEGKYPIVASNGIIGYHNECKAKGPGVTIGRSGNLGQSFFVNIDYWPHNTTLFVLEFHDSDPCFVYYFLKTLNLKAFNAGSAVPTLNRNHIHNMRVIVPTHIKEQKQIGEIFASLDSQIEDNCQMNITLEKIGQALFKHWFIDFEFPNEKGKPYRSSGGKMVHSDLGEIPKGWTVGSLGDICDITMGQSPPGRTYNEGGDGMCFCQGITEFGFRFPTQRVFCTAPTRFAEEGDVLLSVRAPVGSLNVAEEKCAIGRGVASLRLKGTHNGFLYYLLLATKSQWETFEAEGTVFGAATKADVHDFKIVLPPKCLIQAFASLIAPNDLAILNNARESRALAGLRDSLLPKLMSGHIRVVYGSTFRGAT